MKIKAKHYGDILSGKLDNEILASNSLVIFDHMGSFNQHLQNSLLDHLNLIGFSGTIGTEYIVNDNLQKQYKNLKLRFLFVESEHYKLLNSFAKYTMHPVINFKNAVCSFNGSAHVSRQLLTASMKKFELFDSSYSTKNFKNTPAQIEGHLNNLNLTNTQQRVFCKFFSLDETFLNTKYTINYNRFNHSTNIHNLEHILTESFVHVVSNTLATGYYPLMCEKFLYSVVTRGLFVSYAQPNWHFFLEKYYGFKKYNKIFDYSFDTIQNPVERLIKLLEMISKFSKLTVNDWNDLYLIEQDTIEYNYNHYHSKDYEAHLKQYE